MRTGIRVVWLAAACLVAGVSAGAAPAPGCGATVPADRWQGEFFPNTTLSGEPSLVRDDGTQFLNLQFGSLGPNTCGIGVDNFSVRWTRTMFFNAGNYRFTAVTDDGFRLYVDGQLRRDRFVEQGPMPESMDLPLTTGNHTVVMEYFEKGGSAQAQLSWSFLSAITSPLDAVVLSAESSVPSSLAPGESREVTVRLKNTGTTTWTRDAGFSLGASASNTVGWTAFSSCGGVFSSLTDARAFLCPGQSVAPGGTADFTFTVTAPPSGGVTLSVRMVRDGVSFGETRTWPIAVGADPCRGAVAPDRWKGEYYANATLGGSASMVRDDGTGPIGFDWGAGGPGACGLPVDRFSVRWTRTAPFESGTHRFTARADDGLRVYVDDVLKLDKWIDQGPTTYTFDLAMGAGSHVVRMEYYENGGGALVQLSWQLVTPGGGGTGCTETVAADHWKGEYWSNRDFAGAPALVRDDGTTVLGFDWGTGSPSAACGIPVDGFTARFARRVSLETGTYRFTVTTDDGFRLYVDGALKLDEWIDQGPTPHSIDLALAAGPHDLRLDYYEGGGGAVARLSWSLLSTTSCEHAVTASHWKGEYWNNQGFAGAPTMVRDEGTSGLDYDWGQGTPDADCGIPADHFTARFTRKHTFLAGTYRFTIRSDDGFRLYVDGVLRLDKWQNQLDTFTVDLALTAGDHDIRIDYFEDRYGAVLRVSWVPLDNPCDEGVPGVSFMRWRGEYWSNPGLAGPPAMIRDEGTALAFDGGALGPGPACGLPASGYSSRFVRTVHLSDSTYRFTVTAAGGVRFYLDDALKLDRWTEQPSTIHAVDLAMAPGRHVLRLEYSETGGGAALGFELHRLGGGTKSKLSIQTRFFEGGVNAKRFVTEARPTIVKVLDEFTPVAAMKAAQPGLIVIGRINHPWQLQEGDPRSAAHSWWSIHQGTILSPQAALVDYWEGYNEPLATDAGRMAWLGQFDAERVKILAGYGKKAVIGNLGGTPPLDDESWPNFFPAIDEALRHGGILGLHEYGTPLWLYFDESAGEGWLLGRYRKVYRQHLIPTGRVIPLVITETGNDILQPVGWKNHYDGEEYMDQLRWWDEVLKGDPYVMGAQIFSLEVPGWDSFDVAPILPQLIEHVR